MIPRLLELPKNKSFFLAATDADKVDLLRAYVDIYLREEIQTEGIVRRIGTFSRFLDMAASQFGAIVNYSSVARECQQAVMTVKTYYEILIDTLIGVRLEPWRKSIRKRLSGHPKFFFFDNGVTNIINRYDSAISDPYLTGRLFEQFIIIETFKWIRTSQKMVNPYYWRTGAGAEVDLLTEHAGVLTGAAGMRRKPCQSEKHLEVKNEYRQYVSLCSLWLVDSGCLAGLLIFRIFPVRNNKNMDMHQALTRRGQAVCVCIMSVDGKGGQTEVC